MANTSIEWTDKVWNPTTGCTKVSAGCKNCYAESVANRFFAKEYPPNENGSLRVFTDVRCHEDRLEAPLHWRAGRPLFDAATGKRVGWDKNASTRIFVNSMSDLFHEDVPDEFIDRVFAIMALCPQHTFQVLTKRPERMLEYFKSFDGPTAIQRAIETCAWAANAALSPDPMWSYHLESIPKGLRNVWLGVLIENQKAADERIPLLLQTPAAVRFVSYEPALGPVNFMGVRVDCNSCPDGFHGIDALEGHNAPAKLDWVICGGESGPGARPMHPDWARSVRDQCKEAGVPFFFKQWGEWLPFTQDTPHKDASYTQSTAVMHEGGTCSADLMAIPPATAKGTIYGCGRVGKKAAGCLLDGVEHKEFPVTTGKER